MESHAQETTFFALNCGISQTSTSFIDTRRNSYSRFGIACDREIRSA
jgi:hypothetical protein